MPITREPSRRGLNWKWNSSKTGMSSDEKDDRKRAAEPEIIHLGGSRVGNAFEILDLPAPDRSKPAERHMTQWNFNPPPPNPPGIGLAVASPGDSLRGTSGHLHLDDHGRPITQWFPTFQNGAPATMGEKYQNEPRGRSREQSREPSREPSWERSRELVLPTIYPYASSDADTNQEPPSPLSFDSSTNVTPNSPPAAISPLRSPISPVDSNDEYLAQSVQFPKRSTSLSQATRHAPLRLKDRAAHGSVAPLRGKEAPLRRTQSNAEAIKSLEWRGPSPAAQERPESSRVSEASSQELRLQETQRAMRRSPKPLRPIQDPQALPPLTSAPPNAPLPPISGAKLASNGKARDQQSRRGSAASDQPPRRGSTASDRVPETSPPPRETQEPTDGQQPRTESKLTATERLWLHRHYRGEAMFLRAWGLQITSEEDREEGRAILRELLEGEAQEEKEQQAKQRMNHWSGSQSRSSTGTNSSGRDGTNALDVIAEERLSRDFHHLSASSADDQFWRIEPLDTKTDQSRRGRRNGGPEKHTRNESTDSVLGEYLDLRLNHNR